MSNPINRKALGKGLSALIPQGPGNGAPPSSPSPGGTLLLDVERILPNPLQPRRHFDEEKLRDLTASVREHGVLQPVIVSKSNGQYHLVVGERRWRASRAAGLTQIPVVVREFAEAEGLEVALIENLQREDLNPLEEAAAFQYLMREYGMKQDDVATRVGKSRSAVANTVRLLNLPQQIQHDLQSGEISAGHARALLALEDEGLQRKIWTRVKRAHLSVRQTEALVRRLTEARGHSEQPPTRRRQAPEWEDVEERLQRQLSARVQIKPRGRSSGRIEIHYTSGDELDRVLDQLMGRRAWIPARDWNEELL